MSQTFILHGPPSKVALSLGTPGTDDWAYNQLYVTHQNATGHNETTTIVGGGNVTNLWAGPGSPRSHDIHGGGMCYVLRATCYVLVL